jgi:Lrp/AsnC family transcriptional regulator, leucine-responsive regulatory protein
VQVHGARIGQGSGNEIAKYSVITLLLQSMTDLDPITDKILQELLRDAKQSNLDLAQRVGLSPSACLRRVQDLERRDVIRGYRAILDVVYVAVGLSEHTKAAQEGFEAAMTHAPEVVECHNIAGAFEYLLRVEARDLASYKTFHTDVLGCVPAVRSITSYIVMDSSKDARA